MTTIQTNANVLAAIKRESTTGTAATAAGATQIRFNASAGMELKRSQIQSGELRDDGLRSMMRLGGKSVDGSFTGEMTVGGATDILLEAMMRGTWSAASALTTATGAGACVDLTVNSTSQITRTGSGSFITDGWKVGDVANLASYSTGADNNLNLRVTGVAALVLTFAGTPLTVGGADTACTLTRLKKVITPATPSRYSHTIEQYDQDADISELFLGCRLTSLKLSCKPNAMVTYVATFMGMDRTILTTGTSPWFTNPTLTTGLSLIADDSAIWLNGAAAALVTGFDLDFTLSAKLENVLGNFVSPDVFDTVMEVKGTVTAMRTDLANSALFDAETEFELGLLLEEPTTAPKSCISIYLPRVKISGLTAPVGGGDGPKIQTMPIYAGPKAAGTGYDGTIAVISSSAA